MQLKAFFTGIIGNILEHYDSALFGLLAPFIAPHFFHSHDPVTALILTYSIVPLGMVSRPFGSLCFGWIADRWGRRQALFCSLTGMAVVTVSIGFLPTSQEIGPLSPILLAALRMLQSFFASGEAAGGAIYVLEHTEVSKRSLLSSIFDASTVIGILIASGLVAWMGAFQMIDAGWRFLFWAGGLTAVVGALFRLKAQGSQDYVPPPQLNLLKELKIHKTAFFSIILAAGFSYTTFALAFVLMNGYIPLVTSLTKEEVMQVNTALLALDLFLLPLFGLLAKTIGKEKLMFFGALGSFLFAVPLFSMLGPSSSLPLVTAIRFSLVLFGVAFAAPYHAWAIEQVPPHCRSTILCLGYTLGAQVLGTPASAISLWLYQQTGWAFAPALYLLPIALGALISLKLAQRTYNLRLQCRSPCN